MPCASLRAGCQNPCIVTFVSRLRGYKHSPRPPPCTAPSRCRQTSAPKACRNSTGRCLNPARSLQLGSCFMASIVILTVAPSFALELHSEPSNALSLPTWAIHVSSVVEWCATYHSIYKWGKISHNIVHCLRMQVNWKSSA
jgi:hypothetical protein